MFVQFNITLYSYNHCYSYSFFVFARTPRTEGCWMLDCMGCFLIFFTALVCCSTTFQVDKEEVRLRRTIGLKKDEYFLDGKHIT